MINIRTHTITKSSSEEVKARYSDFQAIRIRRFFVANRIRPPSNAWAGGLGEVMDHGPMLIRGIPGEGDSACPRSPAQPH